MSSTVKKSLVELSLEPYFCFFLLRREVRRRIGSGEVEVWGGCVDGRTAVSVSLLTLESTDNDDNVDEYCSFGSEVVVFLGVLGECCDDDDSSVPREGAPGYCASV